MPKKRGKLKRSDMDLPPNIRRALLHHSEGHSWIESAKVANITPHALREWRKHPQAIAFVNESINSSLEESLGSLAQATPALANKLITLALDPKIKGYTAVSAISEAFKILQNGIIDRQNKEELKKIREQLERLEGNPSSFIDV